MKKNVIAIMSVFLVMACLLTACAGKKETRVYKDGVFSDVASGSPYRDYIAAAYEMGLMDGMGDSGTFGVDTNVTVADAVSYACRVHSLYLNDKAVFEETDPWYQTYIDYAVEKGIIESVPDSCAAVITGGEFAKILAGAMPAEALPAINTVVDDGIPGVSMEDEYADSIYLLYRAGIITGGEGGAFDIKAPLTKAEAAQAVARMAASSMRGKITLNEAIVKEFSPDLEEQPAVEDDFFEDAAIVGNSLVEGLKMYSNLDTITYYSGTSMSVSSAETSVIPQMLQKQYAKIYIELGINEIGNDAEYFKGLYGSMIDQIKVAEPEADIYIMAILPVSQAKSNEGSYTIERVKMYNQALYELAAEKQCYYIDVFAALVGADGYLPADETWDGVHLTPDTYSVWENCIRTHYAA